MQTPRRSGPRMRKAIYILVAVLVLGIAGVWTAGIRVVVVQPIGVIPDGVTTLVAGIPGLHLIDSPDAICQRTEGGVSPLCRVTTTASIAENGTIIARLPYSSILFSLSGAPDPDR